MSRRTPLLLLSSVVMAGCASDEATPACPFGVPKVSEGFDICVIQETGIGVVTRTGICPPALPYLHTLETVIVCSADAELPEEVVADLGQPAETPAEPGCEPNCDAPTALAPIEEAQTAGAPEVLAVDAQDTLWIEADGALKRSRGGVTLTLGQTQGATRLAAEGDGLYWVSGAPSNELIAASRDGVPNPAFTLPIDADASMVVDATHVYWVGLAAASRVHRVDRATRQVEDLGASGGGLEIALHGDYVWWRNALGQVRRAARSGGGAPVLEVEAGAIGLAGSDQALVVGHESGYAWGLEAQSPFHPTLFPRGEVPGAMAVGASHVWWATAGLLTRADTAGGLQMVVTAQPALIASGGGRIAWYRQGTVFTTLLD